MAQCARRRNGAQIVCNNLGVAGARLVIVGKYANDAPREPLVKLGCPLPGTLARGRGHQPMHDNDVGAFLTFTLTLVAIAVVFAVLAKLV
jgi:hypothetical protein